ncbi:primosomal protein N' (replication factor Y) [Devosia subaequoris]|uniref:Replication restart protein PriA n=1 Tax=Devosia subaequoris TaxID=395930 RepID=A0A7W6NC74_9HYPH|nr:primosomal protein N' [Devosia subaequoris]MBB4052484.1 primosomal protein N' (replication factor Y) [Devosia subaequoris]MCP1209644.1 primosomal protein N' [Devosia subaequoris]
MIDRPDIVAVMVGVAVEGPYSYRVPAGMSVTRGSIVAVPLGPRLILGVVWGPAKDMIAHNRLREIAQAYDVPPLSEELLKLVEWVARYTLTAPGQVLRGVLRSPEALDQPKPVIAYRRTGHEPERLTPARLRVLDCLMDDMAWPKPALVGASGVSSSVIDGLARAGAVEKIEMPAPPVVMPPNPDDNPAQLNPEQKQALDQILALDVNAFGVALLDGVTGGGKTEVFFEAVADTLRAGRQALVLLPEIALTNTFIDRFTRRFGTRPAEWHSDMTPAQRAKVWRGVLEGSVRAVVGARSALFLPFRQLGLMVLDEEHDGAYKQSDGFTYHARDMAIVRANLAQARVVLSSATPSVESRNNANHGRYAHVTLESRFAEAAMPDVTAIDMRTDGPEKGEWIAPALAREVFAALDRGEQALLFLNRRGYAPLTLCRSCGHQYQCPDCSSWMVEHRFRGVLTCHHCGHEMRTPKVCGECGDTESLVAVGPGVERVAEEAAARFPDARRVLLSTDMGSHAQLRERFSEIERGEFDLIIGTQLVSKGHHFEKLSVVGVLDADLGLAHGDPRAAEKTFQILTQVAGRAGRASRHGKAFLQTYHPDHPVMKAMVSGDREAFYAQELIAREAGGMPPFGRLAALIVSANAQQTAMGFARTLLSAAPMAEGVRLFGPADAPVAMIRGRHRVRLLAQSGKDFDLSGYVRFWLSNADRPKGDLKVQVDIDPMSFM